MADPPIRAHVSFFLLLPSFYNIGGTPFHLLSIMPSSYLGTFLGLDAPFSPFTEARAAAIEIASIFE